MHFLIHLFSGKEAHFLSRMKNESLTYSVQNQMRKTAIRVQPRRKVAARSKKPAAYDLDFHQWSEEQAAFLKKRAFEKLDIDNLAEEIESLGRSERTALESFLAILFLHLLKIKYQPEKHTRSWDLSVKNARYHAQKLYRQNPSMKKYLPALFKDAYFTARLKAIDETGLEEEVFPEECFWSIEEIFPKG